MHQPLDAQPARPARQPADPIPEQACPQCGFPMQAIAGLKTAICRNCGYKEPCC